MSEPIIHLRCDHLVSDSQFSDPFDGHTIVPLGYQHVLATSHIEHLRPRIMSYYTRILPAYFSVPLPRQ